MNILKRAITAQLSHCSHPSRKWRFLLYSTTYTLNPPKPRKRSQPPPPSSSSSISQGVKDEAEKMIYWPRPSEIPYQAKVANLVNLIGHIQTPVKFKTSPDGKYWAGTVIYQENGPEGSCLIPVLFEGDLAHVVACHVKENDCVYVIGRLSEDPMPFVLIETPGKVHLRVQNINFVLGFKKNAFEQRSRKKFGENLFSGSNDIVMTLKEEDKGDLLSKQGVGEPIVSTDRKNFQTSLKSADAKKGEDSVLDPWRELVQNPRQWLDYRDQKSKGLVANKFPDFKHKDTGAGLWLGSAPKWILGGLQSLDFDVPRPKQKQVKDAKEDLLRSLAENPNQWWDNRLNKKNPKAPDFKHKESGEGLWLNSLPDWVLSKLPATTVKQNVAGGRNDA